MAVNHLLLERITLASDASSITFSSIPQSYTDLKIMHQTRSDTANGGYNVRSVYISLNGSTSDFTMVGVAGEASAVFSYVDARHIGWQPAPGATANFFSNSEVYIHNYTSSEHKSFTSQFTNESMSTGGTYTGFGAYNWANTAPITSVSIITETGNFVAGSTFSIYGIASSAVSPTTGPKASGGDIVTKDSTYYYHTFLSSGTFAPYQSLTCDYLVVAGGGAGGSTYAGGGGAGGLRSTVTATGGGGSLESPLSLGTQTYTVLVGGGGAKQNGTGSSGTNSVFASVTAVGGGGGGGYSGSAYSGPASGGAGGGGAMGTTGSQSPGGLGTTNQGRAGGDGSQNGYGGGGGGANTVGSFVTSGSTGASGGAGVASSISGTSVTYAGGGGGGKESAGTAGAGGSGGGGASAVTTGTASDGTANLGGGGGGGAQGGTELRGGAGGSGIVIIRYPI